MAKTLTPAELANRITYFLKGDLKNIQTAYLHAGAKLARIRDESLYGALGYSTMEDYAQARCGMRRTTLYRYLAIYDWARKSHREWRGKHPKGFIPELTDAYGLKWIEERLEDRDRGVAPRHPPPRGLDRRLSVSRAARARRTPRSSEKSTRADSVPRGSRRGGQRSMELRRG